jgi:hypothetical protein
MAKQMKRVEQLIKVTVGGKKANRIQLTKHQNCKKLKFPCFRCWLLIHQAQRRHTARGVDMDMLPYIHPTLQT